jgi:hypothetical protein
MTRRIDLSSPGPLPPKPDGTAAEARLVKIGRRQVEHGDALV